MDEIEGVRAAADLVEHREVRGSRRLQLLRIEPESLVADGDEALSELLAVYPQADRQHLRQLARNAHQEKLKNKPPHAYRELFRELRDLLAEAPVPDEADELEMDSFDETDYVAAFVVVESDA